MKLLGEELFSTLLENITVTCKLKNKVKYGSLNTYQKHTSPNYCFGVKKQKAKRVGV